LAGSGKRRKKEGSSGKNTEGTGGRNGVHARVKEKEREPDVLLKKEGEQKSALTLGGTLGRKPKKKGTGLVLPLSRKREEVLLSSSTK